MSTLQSSSRLYVQIVSQIEKDVLEGVLRPGDKLPSEREMSEHYGVSRTVIREAIRALNEKGLTDIQPGRGTFVANDTSAAMRNSLGLMVQVAPEASQLELVQIRAILEPEIAALAARNATEEDLARLKNTVTEMDRSLHVAGQFIRADQDFHLQLARATQNSMIPLLLDPIVDLLWEQRKRIFLVAGGAERGQYHHKRILKAIIDGDAETARCYMREHLEQVMTDSDASQQHEPMRASNHSGGN